MKSYLVIFVPAALLAIAAITYVNSSNKNSLKDNHQAEFAGVAKSPKADLDSCCIMELTAATRSDNSIYLLNAEWKDQDGNKEMLRNFEGKKVVLAMIYTSCPTACPVIIGKMQSLEAAIPHGELKNYHFLLISIDPNRDTFERMRRFASERSLDPKTWTLLTGSKNNIAELAELIGFKYKENANGNFTHSNLITFLDKDGVIINQSEGLEQTTNDLLAMLNK